MFLYEKRRVRSSNGGSTYEENTMLKYMNDVVEIN